MTLAANKPKDYDGSYINIVTWNVQGLIKDTVDDTMFLSCVNNNDVIILTETWLQGEMDILPNKYFNFHNIRVNSKKSRRRPSGGISVLIRKYLYSNSNQNIKKIQVLKSTDFSVWVKLNKIFFGLEKDVFWVQSIFPQKIQHTIIHISEVVLLMNWKRTSLRSQGMVQLFLPVTLMPGLLIN